MVFAVHRWPSGQRGLRSIGVVERGDDGYVRVRSAWDRNRGFNSASDELRALIDERVQG